MGTAVFGAPTVERLTWMMMVTRCVAVQTNGKVNNVTKMSTNAMMMTVSMIVCLDAKCAGTHEVALSVTASRAGKVTTAEPKLKRVAMKRALTAAGVRAIGASAPTVSVATTVN